MPQDAERILLGTALVRTLHAQATLKRDRMYALLGLVRDSDNKVPMASYHESDSQVFDYAFRHMIVRQGQVDLMLLAGSRGNRNVSPSWLPDWEIATPWQAIPWLTKRLEGTRETVKPVLYSNDTLELEG